MRRSAPRFLSLLLLLPAAPLVAYDGLQVMGFGGGDGVASWPTNTNTATLADIAANDELLIGVGSYRIAGDPPDHLAWQAVDINGELRGDHRCFQPTSVHIPLAVSSAALAARVDGSGNLLVAGHAEFIGSETQQVPVLLRFDLGVAGCVLDESFSGNGYAIYDDLPACQSASCSFVALAEQGPLTGVHPGTYETIGLIRAVVNSLVVRYFIVGLLPDGSVDGDFAFGGYNELTGAPNIHQLASYASLAVDGRGRIYALVSRYDITEPGIDLDTVLLQFSVSGVYVGQWELEDGSAGDTHDSHGADLVIASDGDLLVSYEGDIGGSEILWMLDRQSGSNSRILYPQATAASLLAVQGNARVLAAGPIDGSDGISTRRVLTDSSPPLTADQSWGFFNSFGFLDVDLGGTDSQTLKRVFLWHGRAIFGGNASSASGTRAFLVEVENSYVFADAFDQGKLSGWSTAAH